MAKVKQRPEYLRVRHARQRAKVIHAYGGECLKCGFSDARALQIDHITGRGRAEQTSRKERGINAFSYLKHLLASVNSGLYNLLCANCNWIKRVETGECR